MIAGILNLAGFLFVTTFLLGLYFEGIGPAKIEEKFSKIPLIISILICLILFQIALERYELQFFKVQGLFLVHIFFSKITGFLLHEAGHIYWKILGRTFGTLGGTLNEILLPLILAIYCFGKLYLRLAGLSLFVIGYNLKHVSWYIQDSINRTTEVIEHHGIHDWKYIIDHFNIAEHAPLMSSIAYTLGIISIYSGVSIMFIGVCGSRFIFRFFKIGI